MLAAFFSGRSVRPAWLLIALSACAQFTGGVTTHILGSDSLLNPVRLFPSRLAEPLLRGAAEYGQLFSPVYMVFLVFGLFGVLKACRQNGILGRLRAADILLLCIGVAYTTDFFATVVFAPSTGGPTATQAMLHATSGRTRDELVHADEPLHHAV
jgi:hypothetical protein